MGFTESIQHVLQNYATFNGRALRSEYWFWILFVTLSGMVIGVIGAVIGFPLLGNLYSLALFVPSLAVTVRRLHDRNKSGWWALFGYLPIIGWIWLFIQTVKQGDEGTNRFGPPAPGAGSGATEVPA